MEDTYRFIQHFMMKRKRKIVFSDGKFTSMFILIGRIMCLIKISMHCRLVVQLYIDRAAPLLPLHHIAVKCSNAQDGGRVGSLWIWTVCVLACAN